MTGRSNLTRVIVLFFCITLLITLSMPSALAAATASTADDTLLTVATDETENEDDGNPAEAAIAADIESTARESVDSAESSVHELTDAERFPESSEARRTMLIVSVVVILLVTGCAIWVRGKKL